MVSQFSHSFEASLALPHCPLGLGSWVCAHILSFRPRVSQTAEDSGTPNHLNFWTQYKTRDLAQKLWPPVTLGTLSFNLENNTLGGEHSHFYLWGIETKEVEITCPEVNCWTGIWTQDYGFSAWFSFTYVSVSPGFHFDLFPHFYVAKITKTLFN